MNRLFAGVLTLALLCPLALSAPKAVPLEVTGDTAVVVKSFDRPCEVKAKPGADFYLWTYPDALKATSADGVLTVTSAPKGSYRITVQTLTFVYDEAAKKWNKVRDTGEVTLNVGDVPGPGPDPTPTDPFVKELQAAYDADTGADKAKHLAAYASLYKMAAKFDLAGLSTVGELFAWLLKSRKALAPDTALTKLRPILNSKIEALLGKSADAALTAEQRQRLGSLFGTFQAALEAVKR